MKIGLASDHAGYNLRQVLAAYLLDKGYEVIDYGCPDENSCDYPVYGRKAAFAYARGEFDKGILVCGTGFGIAVSANKVSGIRCVNATDALTVMMSRRHNDANMLSLGARVVGEDLAKYLVDVFLTTEHEGGRHARRAALIDSLPKE